MRYYLTRLKVKHNFFNIVSLYWSWTRYDHISIRNLHIDELGERHIRRDNWAAQLQRLVKLWTSTEIIACFIIFSIHYMRNIQRKKLNQRILFFGRKPPSNPLKYNLKYILFPRLYSWFLDTKFRCSWNENPSLRASFFILSTAQTSAAASTLQSESTLVSSSEISTPHKVSVTPITVETTPIIHTSTKSNSPSTSSLSQSDISSKG